MNTIVGIDILRFVSAVLVVAVHWLYEPVMAGPSNMLWPILKDISMSEIGRMFWFGWVGVPIFFVISGLVIANSAATGNVRNFIRGRVLRLLPGVWICAPLSALTLWIFNVSDINFIIEALIRCLFFIPQRPYVDGSYWTLGVEISFYASMALVIVCGWQKHISLVGAFLGCVSALYITGVYLLLQTEVLTQTDALKLVSRSFEIILLPHGCYFGLGVLLWALKTEGIAIWRVTALGICLVGGICQLVLNTQFMTNSLHNNPLIPIIIWLFSVIFIWWSLGNNQRFSTRTQYIWRQLGMMTYPLYLLHQTIGLGIMYLLSKFGINWMWQLMIVSIIVFFLVSMISLWLEPMLRNKLRIFIQNY
ncbi:MAG: acyltransferase [Alphaproteobacteria bacterium]